jgi:hypothetical protein
VETYELNELILSSEIPKRIGLFCFGNSITAVGYSHCVGKEGGN